MARGVAVGRAHPGRRSACRRRGCSWLLTALRSIVERLDVNHICHSTQASCCAELHANLHAGLCTCAPAAHLDPDCFLGIGGRLPGEAGVHCFAASACSKDERSDQVTACAH